MVVWTDIVESIHKNPFALHSVDTLQYRDTKVDKFPIVLSNLLQKEPSVLLQKEGPVLENPIMISAEPIQEIKQDRFLKPAGKEIDPLVIDLSDTVELYDGSSKQVKKQFECSEALRMEAMLSEIYKSQSGRSRGWTKVGLEALLQPRCASGGDIYELSRSNTAFTWQLVASDKLYSAFLDFLCVSKQIRIAVWFQEEKQVIVFPAADYIGNDKKERSIPLYSITNKGILLKGIRNCDTLIQYCISNNWVMMSPLSIFHSLSLLTLTELASFGEKLGFDNANGTKKERIAKLVSHKLRQRLQNT